MQRDPFQRSRFRAGGAVALIVLLLIALGGGPSPDADSAARKPPQLATAPSRKWRRRF